MFSVNVKEGRGNSAWYVYGTIAIQLRTRCRAIEVQLGKLRIAANSLRYNSWNLVLAWYDSSKLYYSSWATHERTTNSSGGVERRDSTSSCGDGFHDGCAHNVSTPIILGYIIQTLFRRQSEYLCDYVLCECVYGDEWSCMLKQARLIVFFFERGTKFEIVCEFPKTVISLCCSVLVGSLEY